MRKEKNNFVFARFRERIIDFINSNFAVSVIGAVFFFCLLVSPLVYFVEQKSPNANITGIADSYWWGIVTMLTVGYGDRTPVTPTGQLLAVLLMTVGVTAVGILTAKISSYFLEEAMNKRRGSVDKKHLYDHVVICGWKQDMENFLFHILDSNTDLRADDIVLVSNVPDELQENLLSEPRLKKVKFVKGDFFTESVLMRAAPERAKKIILLADSSPSVTGERPTATEADARTVMAAMTLDKIAKSTPIIAEIVDPKMDQYLKIAHINEIVYSRDYSRLVVARATTGTGIPNIIRELLDVGGEYNLTTREIPQEFINQPYGDFRRNLHATEANVSVIGLLENTGNSHSVKDTALRQAQHTPDVQQLVQNLQKVKTLEFNKPVLAPSKEYVVKEGTMAIVIEGRVNRGIKNELAS